MSLGSWEHWRSDIPDALRLAILEAIASDASVGACIIDSSLRYVYINDALAENNGLPVKAHLGKTIEEVVPGLLEPIWDTVVRVVEGRELIPDILVEGETPREPGVRRVWRQSWYPLAINSPECFTAILVHEITDERKLVEKVARANRHKSELMSTVAHEMRNPLAPIENAVNILRQVKIPLVQDVSDLIARQVVQLARLVDDLTLAGGSSNSMRIDRVPVRLRDVIDDARTNTAAALHAKHHTLRISASNLDREVLGDHLRLTQVVSNVLSNAIKYTADGGDIQIVGWSERGTEVIEVLDNGPGIPPHLLTEVFEPFFRAVERTGHVEGSGIGLWVAQDLIERHGGQMSARCRPITGTAIRIVLPQEAACLLARPQVKENN